MDNAPIALEKNALVSLWVRLADGDNSEKLSVSVAQLRQCQTENTICWYHLLFAAFGNLEHLTIRGKVWLNSNRQRLGSTIAVHVGTRAQDHTQAIDGHSALDLTESGSGKIGGGVVHTESENT